MKYTFLDNMVFLICGTVLIILFAGEPDLMDAIIGLIKGACGK